MLAEYIDSGSYFLAAKVAEEAAEADGSPLSPLQLSYDSDIFSIPIRLATLNSPGVQDMIIYAMVDSEEGRVGIANYPEFEVPSACVWGQNGETFGEFYEDHYNSNWEEQGDAAWAVEYSGGPASCSPCSGWSLTERDVSELGFDGSYWYLFFTRIHLRYTPEQATEDLMLYPSRIYTNYTMSFADNNDLNRSCIETFCDGSLTPEEPYESMDTGPSGNGQFQTEKTPAQSQTGCLSVASFSWSSALLGLGILFRRKR
jgi:hypothetical protein